MAKPSFTWEDPFLLDSQLAADERQVRNAARDFAQKALKPRIRDAFSAKWAKWVCSARCCRRSSAAPG